MLGMKSYSREYVDACRTKVDSDVAAYRNQFGKGKDEAASEPFESVFFNNMLLVLDYLFVHRFASIDGRDGNPLNEVRVMADSILNNGGVMTPGTVSKASQMRFNKGIKMVPEKTVLKYQVGDEIKLTQIDFERLSEAFFAELESKYLQ